MTKYPFTLLAPIAILSGVPGCGPNKSAAVESSAASAQTASQAPQPAASTGAVACQVNVSGDPIAAWTGYMAGADAPIEMRGKVTGTSEYYLSEATIREALAQLERAADLEHKKTPQQFSQELEADMKKDPRLEILRMHCITDGGSLILTASSGSKYGDIPFAPKSYRVSGLGAGRGEFVVERFHVGGRPSYRVGEGKLDLTKFDASGVKGTFSFNASSRDGKTVVVSGSVDYPTPR